MSPADETGKEPDSCLNCDAALGGEYCHVCGQRGRDVRRPLWTLIRELVHETFDLDGRFTRSLRPLFLQPGRLTREYNDGRRVRFTSPLRLFLFASLLFFVTASPACPLTPDMEREPIPSPADEDGSKPIAITTSEGEITIHREARIVRLWFSELGEQEYYVFGRNKRDLPLRERYAHAVGTTLARMQSQDPSVFDGVAEKLLEWVGRALFFLIPVYALAVRLVVRRPRRTYVEHLVMSLHVHAFVFIVLTGTNLAEVVLGDAMWIYAGSALGLIVYVIAAFRCAYGSTTRLALARAAGAFLLYLVVAIPTLLALGALSLASAAL